jgi:hypothetical protein
MQVRVETDLSGRVDRLLAAAMRGMRGLAAWRAPLQAHATLLRQLETDLDRDTGLALADFDVLAQLARADGALMTEFAAGALISPCGMTRRAAVRKSSTKPASLPDLGLQSLSSSPRVTT